VEFRKALQPAELEIVLADHAGVRRDALPEVDEPVGPEGGSVGVVIAVARKALDQRIDPAVARNAKDAAALQLPAFGDEEGAVRERDTGPRAVLLAARNFRDAAVRLDEEGAAW
jgi:hypothetical protein